MIHKKNITFICQLVDKEKACSIAKKLCIDLPVSLCSLNSIQELFPLISDPNFHTDFIAIDIEYFYNIDGAEIFDVIKTISTLLRCTVERTGAGRPVKRNTKILGVVGWDTDPKLIKEILSLLDGGVCLRIGGGITYDDVREDIKKYISGDFSVPKIVQEILKKEKKKPIKKEPEVSLTPRQTQILHLLSHRGASNKVIAKMLNISESTVKLHMSAILKKFGVRNRTQLAVFHKNQEK